MDRFLQRQIHHIARRIRKRVPPHTAHVPVLALSARRLHLMTLALRLLQPRASVLRFNAYQDREQPTTPYRYELTMSNRSARGNVVPMSLFRCSPRIAQYPSVGEIPLHNGLQPAFKKVKLRKLIRECGKKLSRREIIELRAGRKKPHRKTQELLAFSKGSG